MGEPPAQFDLKGASPRLDHLYWGTRAVTLTAVENLWNFRFQRFKKLGCTRQVSSNVVTERGNNGGAFNHIGSFDFLFEGCESNRCHQTQ